MTTRTSFIISFTFSLPVMLFELNSLRSLCCQSFSPSNCNRATEFTASSFQMFQTIISPNGGTAMGSWSYLVCVICKVKTTLSAMNTHQEESIVTVVPCLIKSWLFDSDFFVIVVAFLISRPQLNVSSLT